MAVRRLVTARRQVAALRWLGTAGWAAAGAATLGCTGAGPHPARVELTARAPERGNWSPRTIRVTRGTEVTLVIRNPDVLTHGFYLPALGLHVSDIKAGDVKTVTFRPQTSGTFPFYCSVWCGDYHMHMRGELIVD